MVGSDGHINFRPLTHLWAALFSEVCLFRMSPAKIYPSGSQTKGKSKSFSERLCLFDYAHLSSCIRHSSFVTSNFSDAVKWQMDKILCSQKANKSYRWKSEIIT